MERITNKPSRNLSGIPEEQKRDSIIQGGLFSGHTITWIQKKGSDFVKWTKQSFASAEQWVSQFIGPKQPSGGKPLPAMEVSYFNLAPTFDRTILPEFDEAKENEGSIDKNKFDDIISQFSKELNLSQTDSAQIIEKFNSLPPMSIAQKRQLILIIADKLSKENEATGRQFKETRLYDSASKGAAKALDQEIKSIFIKRETPESLELVTRKIEESLIRNQDKDQVILNAFDQLSHPMTVKFGQTMMYRDAVMNKKGGRVIEDVKNLIDNVKNIKVEEGKYKEAVDDIMAKIEAFGQKYSSEYKYYAILKVHQALPESLKQEFFMRGSVSTANKTIPDR